MILYLNTFPERPILQMVLQDIQITRRTLLKLTTVQFSPNQLSNASPLRLYDDALAGHYGVAKTLELVSRNYYFPGMAAYVKKYVNTCDTCARGKPTRHAPHGELALLPAPTGPWKGISCDFVVDLPVSLGYDAALVFIDRLTKMAHFIPCTKTATAADFARMFLDHVVRLHGLPDSIVSDRGAIFTSKFWKPFR